MTTAFYSALCVKKIMYVISNFLKSRSSPSKAVEPLRRKGLLGLKVLENQDITKEREQNKSNQEDNRLDSKFRILIF